MKTEFKECTGRNNWSGAALTLSKWTVGGKALWSVSSLPEDVPRQEEHLCTRICPPILGPPWRCKHRCNGDISEPVTFSLCRITAGWVVCWKIQLWAFWSTTNQRTARCPLSGLGPTESIPRPLRGVSCNSALIFAAKPHGMWLGSRTRVYSLFTHPPKQPGLGTLIVAPSFPSYKWKMLPGSSFQSPRVNSRGSFAEMGFCPMLPGMWQVEKGENSGRFYFLLLQNCCRWWLLLPN